MLNGLNYEDNMNLLDSVGLNNNLEFLDMMMVQSFDFNNDVVWFDEIFGGK